MRRAVPLSVQLLLTFVGLLVGMAAVIDRCAYTSLRATVESEVSRSVANATRSRKSESRSCFICVINVRKGSSAASNPCSAEPLDAGRLAWVDACVRPMVDDFRKSERAIGAMLTYRGRRSCASVNG